MNRGYYFPWALNPRPPIVTGGVDWAGDTSSGTIYVFSISSGDKDFSSALGNVAHFCTPTSGDGRVFVAANDQEVAFL